MSAGFGALLCLEFRNAFRLVTVDVVDVEYVEEVSAFDEARDLLSVYIVGLILVIYLVMWWLV